MTPVPLDPFTPRNAIWPTACGVALGVAVAVAAALEEVADGEDGSSDLKTNRERRRPTSASRTTAISTAPPIRDEAAATAPDVDGIGRSGPPLAAALPRRGRGRGAGRPGPAAAATGAGSSPTASSCAGSSAAGGS